MVGYLVLFKFHYRHGGHRTSQGKGENILVLSELCRLLQRGVPKSARITYGFCFWSSEHSALFPWHYQSPSGNPFNDFDSTFGDWYVAYPGSDGPIPTQRWEAMQDGIDDYKYIYTLEQYIRQAEQYGKADTETRQAKEYLKRLWNSFEPQLSYNQDWSWDHKKFQKYRQEIAGMIAAIGKKIKLDQIVSSQEKQKEVR